MLRQYRHQRGNAFALMLAMALATGCGGGANSDPPLESARQYQLRTAAQQPLPATILDTVIHDPSGDFRLRYVVLQASLGITQSGNYTHQVKYRCYIDNAMMPPQLWNDRGTYTVSNSDIHFESDYFQNQRYEGTQSANSITLENDLSGEGVPVPFVFAHGISD